MPFDGIADLVRTFTGYQRMQTASPYSSYELVAPVWVRFGPNCAIKSARIYVEVLMRSGHNPGNVSLGVIQKDSNRILARGRHRLNVKTGRETEQITLAQEIPFLRAADRVTLFLSYQGDRVDQLELHRNRVSGANPRMSVLASVDPNLKSFGEGLRGELIKPGRGFERSFLALLSFLGFSCIHVGTDQNSPDILAWALSPAVVFVVECTTDQPDLRNKATKFASRLRHVRSVSRTSEPVGVMAATLSKEEVNPADLERLKSDSILLVDSNGLGQLLQLAERGGSVGEALELLEEFASSQSLPYRKFTPWAE